MAPAPVLVVVHNHRYPANIAVLDRLYAGRFSRVFHLVPFHRDGPAHVVPVYEHSHQFQGYITQGLHAFHDPSAPAPHYLFIGDDVLLHPGINERTYLARFGVEEDMGFLPGFLEPHRFPGHWRRIGEVVRYRPEAPGVEAGRLLPPPEEARCLLARHGVESAPLPHTKAIGPAPTLRPLAPWLRWWKQRLSSPPGGHHPPGYPLVGSYSDVFIVPGNGLADFAHYCGLFAATRLFAELAIPTALALSTARIRTEKDLAEKGGALWTSDELRSLDRFGNDLDALLVDFPADTLYLHPVKLSRWRLSEP